MPINPALKLKLDELFLRWLTDPATQKVLHENLIQVKRNESLEAMLAIPSGLVVGPMSSALYSYFYNSSSCESPGPPSDWMGGTNGLPLPGSSVGSLVSPRPNTPPYFPQPPHSKVFSPRSPRRQSSSGHYAQPQTVIKTSADTRPSDAEKKSRTDDGTAKVRTSAASPIPMVDDGSSATAKSPTVPNENRRSTSRSSDRVISKQPAPTTYPDTEATRPDTTPAQNRTAASPRTQISSSGAGGVGDVNPALTRTQKPHTSPSHLPCPPKQQLTSPILSKPVPAFHFPLGTTRMTNEEIAFEMDRAKRELTLAVEQLSPSMDAKKSADPLIPYSGFGQIAKALNCSFYWKYLIYSASGGTADRNPIPLSSVLKTWHKVLTTCPDECARFVYMLTGGRSNYLVPSNFDPLIQDILESHPGLEFLREAEDFHSRYVATVVSRIFFNVNASWSGRISLAELRRSNFLSVLASLEDERDINLVTQYFSYEHFYVIYCKFWELDDDHDLIISRSDLARHNNYAISERMIDRIFSGTVTRGDAFKEGVMHYTDFVWFLLAEEDKRHPRSIEYWFRCMDLDGDGLLSMFELEYFYSEQLVRMEEMGIEPISFEDCLCQCLDMVKPELGDKIRLSDMKRCRLCHIFFDTFFNLPKYLQHEQRDPFSNLRDIEEGLNELSDWDRYAAEAYEMLITIENGNQEDAVDEDDPDEDDLDDAILATPTNRTTEAKQMQSANVGNNKLTEQKMLVESVGGGETTGPSTSPESNHKGKIKRGGMTNGTILK